MAVIIANLEYPLNTRAPGLSLEASCWELRKRQNKHKKSKQAVLATISLEYDKQVMY